MDKWEYFHKILSNYRGRNDFLEGWLFDEELMVGSFYWANEKGVTIYATPFWEDAEGIDIMVTDTEGNIHENFFTVLPIEITGNPIKDAEEYFDIMTSYIRVTTPYWEGLK